MKTTYCQQVTVRFTSPNHQMVCIRHDQSESRTRYLKIDNDGSTLSIKYCDKEQEPIKEIVYNFAHVLEYDCTGWVQVGGTK